MYKILSGRRRSWSYTELYHLLYAVCPTLLHLASHPRVVDFLSKRTNFPFMSNQACPCLYSPVFFQLMLIIMFFFILEFIFLIKDLYSKYLMNIIIDFIIIKHTLGVI